MPATLSLYRLAVAALLAFAASASAAAQTRFVEACASSPDIQSVEQLDASALCQCIATTSVSRGVLPADLDRSVDHPATTIAEVPDDLRAAAGIMMESTASCANRQATGVIGEQAAGVIGESPTTGEPAMTAAPPVRPSAVGLRTGNGNGPVRTAPPSPGGAIRIIG